MEEVVVGGIAGRHLFAIHFTSWIRLAASRIHLMANSYETGFLDLVQLLDCAIHSFISEVTYRRQFLHLNGPVSQALIIQTVFTVSLIEDTRSCGCFALLHSTDDYEIKYTFSFTG